LPKNARETFKYIYNNAGAIAAGTYVVIEDRLNAEKNRNLPHNQLVVSNQSGSVTLYIFLDNFADQNKPDYIVFPNQQMVVNYEEGATFTQVFIKNTHGADDVAINELKVRISTVKEGV